MSEQAVLQDARQYLAMLHKRRGIILTSLGLCLAIAVLYNYTTRPVYQATTQLLIDRDTNVLPNTELVEMVRAGWTLPDSVPAPEEPHACGARSGAAESASHPELATGPMMNPWSACRGS